MFIVFNIKLLPVMGIKFPSLFLLTAVFMTVLLFLHSFHNLFFYHIYIVHHSQTAQTAGVKGCSDLIHPLLHGSSIADHQIRFLNGNHICGRRFKGMAVHPGRYDQI